MDNLHSSVHIDGPYLRFIAITPADAGHYICTASNEYGDKSKIAQVVVRRPNYYQPQPQSQIQEGHEGQQFQLRCTVTSSRGGQHDNNVQVSGELWNGGMEQWNVKIL